MAGHLHGSRRQALVEKELNVEAHDRLARCDEGLPSLVDGDQQALLIEQSFGLAEDLESTGGIAERLASSCLSEVSPQLAIEGARLGGELCELVERAQRLSRLALQQRDSRLEIEPPQPLQDWGVRFDLARSRQGLLRQRQALLLEMRKSQVDEHVGSLLRTRGVAGLVPHQRFRERAARISDALTGLTSKQLSPGLVVEELALLARICGLRRAFHALEELGGLAVAAHPAEEQGELLFRQPPMALKRHPFRDLYRFLDPDHRRAIITLLLRQQTLVVGDLIPQLCRRVRRRLNGVEHLSRRRKLTALDVLEHRISAVGDLADQIAAMPVSDRNTLLAFTRRIFERQRPARPALPRLEQQVQALRSGGDLEGKGESLPHRAPRPLNRRFSSLDMDLRLRRTRDPEHELAARGQHAHRPGKQDRVAAPVLHLERMHFRWRATGGGDPPDHP